jgi:sRNA-binding regulator protein Hfq
MDRTKVTAFLANAFTLSGSVLRPDSQYMPFTTIVLYI